MQYMPPNSLQQVPKTVKLIHTETTRYLCAAAHIDQKFRDYVMKNIVEEEHRAIGELYGVDIVHVVQWCFAAQERTRARDILLFILAMIFIVVAVTIVFSYPAYDAVTGTYSMSAPPFGVYLLWVPLGIIIMMLLSFLPSLILLLLFLFFLIVSVSRSPLFLLFFLAVWLIATIEVVMRYYGSRAKLLTKNRFRSDFVPFVLNPGLEQKLRNFGTVQDGNVVVYSGYSPFVGAGFDIGGWSFTVDMFKGKEETGRNLTPLPFQVGELYDTISRAVAYLNLKDLVIEDKLFVNGQEIRDDRRFLADPQARPFMQTDPTLVHQLMENPSQDVRYYKCFRVTSWKGEMVLSIFIRFIKIGKNLFMEADYLLLPPLKESYYAIDTIEPALTLRKFAQLMGQSFLPTIVLWYRSPVRVFSLIFHDWLLARRQRRMERLIRENPAFDYGADSSLREVASTANYRRHFQRLDKEMYVKTIESQLLDTIINFLDGKNIDTSVLRQRQQVIQNSGVIVSGGTFQASNVAVGDQARAVLSNFAGAVQGIVQGGNAATAQQQEQTTKLK